MDRISKYLIIAEPNSSNRVLHNSKKELLESLENATKLSFKSDSTCINEKYFKYELKLIEKRETKDLKQFFVLVLHLEDENDISQLELVDKEINNFVESYNDLRMLILEDVLSQYYSKKAYELIHIIENKTRALIAEVMFLKSNSLSWENSLTKSLGIRDTGKSDQPLSGKYFSDLTTLLFTTYEEKIPDGFDSQEIFVDSIANLSNLIKNRSRCDSDFIEKNFNELENYINQIQQYAPRSVWDRYIASSLKNSKKLSNSLNTILKGLESPRNSIAHNKTFRKENYEKLKADSDKIIVLIQDAISLFESEPITSYSEEEEKDINVLFDTIPEESSKKNDTNVGGDLTIIVPTSQEGFEETFLGEKQWYDIRISENNRDKIRFIAAYETAPVSGIQYFAEVEEIVQSDNYVGYWKIKFKKETLQKYPEIKKVDKVFPPRNIIYTSKKLLDEAENLDYILSAKFYAVQEGRHSGIYTTWEEAEKQVKGFSGAVYKSFKTYIEAEEFLNSRSLEL